MPDDPVVVVLPVVVVVVVGPWVVVVGPWVVVMVEVVLVAMVVLVGVVVVAVPPSDPQATSASINAAKRTHNGRCFNLLSLSPVQRNLPRFGS
jgi:hypothetical protein